MFRHVEVNNSPSVVRKHLERSCNFQKSVAYIIIMNGWQRDTECYEFSRTAVALLVKLRKVWIAVETGH